MKRTIITLGIVGIVLTMASVSGWLVYRVLDRSRFPNWVPGAIPISYVDMEKLQDNGDIADTEIPRLVACFDVNDEDLRIKASETLGKVGPRAVAPVREKLKSTNPKVRFCAVQTLAFLGPDAAPAADDLLACMKDDDFSIRYKAIYAVGKVGIKSDAAIDALIKALSDKNEDVSGTAIEVLEKIDTPSKESVPLLAKLANKDSAPAVRGISLKLLGRVGEPAVLTFKDLLKNADTLDTVTIIQAIAPLGAHAKPLLPEFQAIMVKSRFWDAQEEMIGTFKKCGPDGVDGLVIVLKTLHDPKSPHFLPNDDRTKVLLKAIGDMGAQAKPAVPLLIDLLKERDYLRPDVLETLGSIGPAASDAIPAVEALLDQANLEPQARTALRRMGKLDKKVN